MIEMVDVDGKTQENTKNFAADIQVKSEGYHMKGLSHINWGMKDRLSRIFNPKSGKTLMLAFDHGYCMGPTSGVERPDLSMPPLIPHIDCMMCSRGVLASCISPTFNKPFVMRSSTGASILKDLSNEVIGVTVEDAVRHNASAITCQVCIGSEHEKETLANLAYLINEGNRFGIPTLGVTAVGKEMVRDSRYLGLATRMIAELGAHFVKTYFCETGFEDVVAGCPVPIVIAGGKKLPELDALAMAYNAIQQGAAGVDMGRYIFLAGDPVAMVQAVREVVHNNETPEKAFQKYNDLKS